MSQPRTAREIPVEQWPETTARVISSEYQYADCFAANEFDGYDESYFLTAFTYHANGQLYVSEHRTGGPQEIGSEFPLAYDPTDPQYNSLTGPRQKPSAWLLKWSLIVLFGCAFLYLLQHFDLSELSPD